MWSVSKQDPVQGGPEMERQKDTLCQAGGGPYDPTMEQRVAKPEIQMDDISDRLNSIDSRLDRIEDKILSKWDMAQVVFYVVGGLMAAAIFGPRLASMIPAGQ